MSFGGFRGFNGGWGCGIISLSLKTDVYLSFMVNLSIVLYTHTIQELKDNVPQPF